MKLLRFVFASIFMLSCTKKDKPAQSGMGNDLDLSYSVLTTLPHDSDGFTEGLEIYENKLLESTGQHGTSWIAEVDSVSGKHNKKVILPEKYFGEGITVLNNKVYHLTYRSRVGFIYDAKTYRKIAQFSYDSKIKEGWGLTHNDSSLIMSDGTDKVHFIDTIDFKVIKSISVREGGIPITQINELELAEGYIFANVWETNLILKIDIETGAVVGKLDLSPIANRIRMMYPQSKELNGIAYDNNAKAFLVTGKNWPESFLIRIN